MRADQAAALRAQRDAAAVRLQRILDTPESERPKDGRALRDWLDQLEAERKSVQHLEQLLKPPAPSGGRARAQRLAEREAAGEDVLVGAIPKGDGDEIRIAVRSWSGGKTIDMRLFEVGAGGEPRATRKGLQFDARHLPALLAALTKAQGHV